MKLKDLIIASPTNNYQPWIMSKAAMACFIFSIWTLRLFVPSYIAVSAPGLDSQDLMAKINIERTNRYLPALITNSKLNNAAFIKSSDMIERSYFAHVNPDGNYVWPVIEAQGYKPYQSLGENLAIDFFSAEEVVKAWMNSPGHRANVLSEKYVDQGMAAVYGEFEQGHETYLITNLFGTLLKSTTPPPAPTPTPNPVTPPTSKPTPQPSPTPSVRPITPPTSTPIAQNPTPSPVVTPVTPTQPQPSPQPISPTPSNVQTTIPTDSSNKTPLILQEKAGLLSLKILFGLFAAIYTILLAIDSLIIHRALIRRENLHASTHSLMFLLVALVSFATLWI